MFIAVKINLKKTLLLHNQKTYIYITFMFCTIQNSKAVMKNYLYEIKLRKLQIKDFKNQELPLVSRNHVFRKVLNTKKITLFVENGKYYIYVG